MSALTKALIILLCFSSLFLCGVVVTYVATAHNYKARSDDQATQIDALNDRLTLLTESAREQQLVTEEKVKEYENRILQLTTENTQLQADLKNALRESRGHQHRADQYQGILESYAQTLANQEQTIKNTQAKLDEARGALITSEKQLNEKTARMYELTVQLDALEAERRRIVEEKKQLEDRLSQIAQAGGMAVARPQPVTPERTTVTAVEPLPAGEVDLTALISEVHENLATISIGSAAGVTRNMRFHVTRGDEFICDIVITDVDTDKAAGVLELKLQQPQIGDNASTKLM